MLYRGKSPASSAALMICQLCLDQGKAEMLHVADKESTGAIMQGKRFSIRMQLREASQFQFGVPNAAGQRPYASHGKDSAPAVPSRINR